jgi:class 3 adenylate cyclase
VRVSAGGPPSGVVTFLFTDIEGSTRRWESDADAMRLALVAHDKVLRTAIEAYDGFVFSHTGDGFVAAFASPMSAVNAAIDAQRESQLPVKMGIATGEAELREGDYFGTVLNRAARVMAAGHGGQILVAESTAGLLSGVDLVDLGPRRLRDVPTPVAVFQVRAPGLRMDFPLNGVVRLRAQTRWPGQWGSAVFATSSMSLSVFSPPCGPGDRCRAGTGLGRCLRPKSYSRATLSAQAWNGLLRLASMMCAPSRLCANCSGSS